MMKENQMNTQAETKDNDQVVDLLHQPILNQPNRTAVVSNDAQTPEVAENAGGEGGVSVASDEQHEVSKDLDVIEDLQIESEESVDLGGGLDHLQPAISHRNLQPMVDGKLQGVVESRDKEGNLVSHHKYEEGVLHGEAVTYDSDQRISNRMNYQYGVPHGPAEFYQNGKALMHTQYAGGEMHGETTYYDLGSGMVTARINHQNGNKNGSAVSYDKLGKVQRVLHYSEDELDGPAFSYYPDGGVLQEGHYVEGKKHGQFTTYYRNGEQRMVEFYENGRLTRKPVLFTPDGDEYEPVY
jgi:antitoxin component YwqK of YwqJK toxin-antitoxin module